MSAPASSNAQRARFGLAVELLADGAHEMWNLLESHFPKAVFGKTSSRVDFCHTIEKRSAAANITHASENSRETPARWKLRQRRCAKANDGILAELRGSGKQHIRIGDSRPVHEAITYLESHPDRMDYAAARKAGLPIGSGNVEATSKSLFQLPALALSDRRDSAMHKFWATQRAAVRAVA